MRFTAFVAPRSRSDLDDTEMRIRMLSGTSGSPISPPCRQNTHLDLPLRLAMLHLDPAFGSLLGQGFHTIGDAKFSIRNHHDDGILTRSPIFHSRFRVISPVKWPVSSSTFTPPLPPYGRALGVHKFHPYFPFSRIAPCNT